MVHAAPAESKKKTVRFTRLPGFCYHAGNRVPEERKGV